MLYARHDRSFGVLQLSATPDKCSIGSHYIENSKIEITYHSKVHQIIIPHVTGLRGEVWGCEGRYGFQTGGLGLRGEEQGPKESYRVKRGCIRG